MFDEIQRPVEMLLVDVSRHALLSLVDRSCVLVGFTSGRATLNQPRRYPDRQKKASDPKAAFRRIVEFKGISTLSDHQYRRRIRDLYDGPAGAMLAIGSRLSLHEPLVGRMIRRGKFDVTRFRRILDIGAGAGQILGHLLRVVAPGTQIVACDLSQPMLCRARQRTKSKRPLYVSADMTHLPFADGQFDCITCGYVLEHLSDPHPGLNELQRVLAPGGSMLLMATEDTYLGALTSRTWKCRTYNRDELQTACESAGLPWNEELWFTPAHRYLRMGGILVEARKPLLALPAATSTACDAQSE